MAKVATEQDVISFLKEKVDSLKQELKKAEDGLAFFTGSASSAPTGKKRGPKAKIANLIQAVPEKAKRGRKKKTADVGSPVEAVPAALKQTRTRKSASRKSAKSVSVPDEFADSLTRDAKIIFALNQITSGNAEDVTSKLQELEPGQDQAKLHRLVTQRLSALAIKGQLKSEKNGRKSLYSLS